MSATQQAVAHYQAMQAEAERAAQLEAQLHVDALLVRTCAPIAPAPVPFAWVESPEAIAAGLIIAALILVAACAGWL